MQQCWLLLLLLLLLLALGQTVAAAVGMPDAVASAASLTNFRCCSLLSCLTEAATGVWWLTIGIWQTGHHDI